MNLKQSLSCEIILIFSLTPDFSPVKKQARHKNRFNGFSSAKKPLKRLANRPASNTPLKQGVNETETWSFLISA